MGDAAPSNEKVKMSDIMKLNCIVNDLVALCARSIQACRKKLKTGELSGI